MIIGILAGGPVALLPEKLPQVDGWIGVDAGNLVLLKQRLIPMIAVGDYDSLSKSQLAFVEAQVKDIRYAKPEKDLTDTEMALRIAFEDLKATRVIVLGATGGRIDHLLNNLFAPLQSALRAYLPQITWQDQQNEISYFLPGMHTLTKLPEMHYLAFIPLTPVTGLTLIDEKYRLDQATTQVPIAWSSNEFSGDKNHFSFATGIVMVIQSRDAN